MAADSEFLAEDAYFLNESVFTSQISLVISPIPAVISVNSSLIVSVYDYRRSSGPRAFITWMRLKS